MTQEADFGELMREQLAQVQERNTAALAEVADVLMERVVAGGGVVLAAGAGHSFNAVTEAFHRAGGLATVKPLHDSRLQLVNGASSSTAAERTPGLAADVLDRAKPDPGDVLFVFSTSGVNFYPVEMAREAADRRIPRRRRHFPRVQRRRTPARRQHPQRGSRPRPRHLRAPR